MKKLPGTKSVSNKPIVKPSGKTPTVKQTDKMFERGGGKAKKKAK